MMSRSFLMLSDDEGRPSSSSVVASGLRFHLAEDRIRDLLMGENLYGEPRLAIREAYQNALDACRLAAARRELLRLPPVVSAPGSHEIEFEQGVDAHGRAYIDCVDHGAGMGVEELSIAFCQAGVRSSDLGDRAAEAAAFAGADPPVELWQNSRFGIGVMSYFMIADAVTVTTARLNPDGSVGRLLSLHIPGPADTFDAVDHGPSQSHGTRIRLWLKPKAWVSAVSTLRDLVITCPVRLRVADQDGQEHRWEPDELNRASSELELPPHEVAAEIPGTLWWVREGLLGAVLADGIWAGVRLPGMVVNLHGRNAPGLTADRRNIVDVDHRVIESLCEASAASAVENAWNIVGETSWIRQTTIRFPRLADAIVANAAIRHDRRLTLHGVDLEIEPCGYMPGDEDHWIRRTPATVMSWRLSRLTAARLYPDLHLDRTAARSVRPARPTDAILLGLLPQLERFGQVEHPSRWFPSTASIYEAERYLRYPVSRIVSRARDLGLPVREGAERLPESNDIVRTALSFSRRARSDGTFRPLGAFDLVQTAWKLGLQLDDVIPELDERFIEFDEFARTFDMASLSPALLIAASREANGVAPWLRSTEDVGLKNVVRASRASGRSCEEVIDLMRSLGLSGLPVLDLRGISPTDDDIRMVSRDLDSESPFLRADEVWATALLEKAAAALGRPAAALRARFLEFGVEFSDEGTDGYEPRPEKKDILRQLGLTKDQRRLIRPRQVRLLSQDGDRRAPWLDPSRPVPAWLIATIALHGRSIDTVIADYRFLGYDVDDPRTAPVTTVPGADATHP